MTAAPHHIDPTAYLEQPLTQASPDLMRKMPQNFIYQFLSAPADVICDANYATVSSKRTTSRGLTPPLGGPVVNNTLGGIGPAP